MVACPSHQAIEAIPPLKQTGLFDNVKMLRWTSRHIRKNHLRRWRKKSHQTPETDFTPTGLLVVEKAMFTEITQYETTSKLGSQGVVMTLSVLKYLKTLEANTSSGSEDLRIMASDWSKMQREYFSSLMEGADHKAHSEALRS